MIIIVVVCCLISSWTWSQSVYDSMPEHTDLLPRCGSVSTLLDTTSSQTQLHDASGSQDQRDTKHDDDALDPVSSNGGYCEVQLAVAMQWSSQQRKMILLEQLICRCDDDIG